MSAPDYTDPLAQAMAEMLRRVFPPDVVGVAVLLVQLEDGGMYVLTNATGPDRDAQILRVCTEGLVATVEETPDTSRIVKTPKAGHA